MRKAALSESGPEYRLVEKPAIDQFVSLKYTHIHGSELSPEAERKERRAYRDVVLQKRLRVAIQRLNPWISDENLRKVVRETTHIQAASLLEANQLFYERLVKLTSVEQDLGKGRRSHTVHLIDFDNAEKNEFLVVNQFKIRGQKEPIIPDIIIFINGLPIAVIECKSPTITDPMAAGIKQLLRYSNRRTPESQEGSERLFWYNQFMVSTFANRARLGTISSGYEHYLEWKDPYPPEMPELGKNPTSQQVLIAGIFEKSNLLDLIRNFIVFDSTGGRTVKKVARYQQYRAVHKAIHRIKAGKSRREKGGIIWHTQGSGKSLTAVFLVQRIRRDPELRGYKIVFLTDRTQLDRQITSTFQKTQDETVHHAGSIRELKALLSRDSPDIVTGMLQKFVEKEGQIAEVLNESERIIVLADEAHRGHYTALATNLNMALPNAPKIALTGTPLVKSQKTSHEFGTYIDTYTIEQAVRDEATVQIIYEGRASKTKVTGESLDRLFAHYFSDRSKEEQDAIKRRYGTELAVLEAPKRIEMVCIDLLKHYTEHIQPNGFKAQIVTASRRAAVLYKETIDRLGGPEARVIISGLHNDEDFYTKYTDKTQQTKFIERFLKPMEADQLSMLVVKDMLLTGFDAPVEQVMYLDRKLTDHNLLQAIARVNRVGSGSGGVSKKRGFIIDYYGLADYLHEALQDFSTEDVSGALIPLKDEIPKLEKRHQRAIGYFNAADRNDLEACILALSDEETRQSFDRDFKNFMESMDIVMPNEAASPFIPDMKWLGKVSIAARNRYRDDELDIRAAGEKVRRLIDEHVYSEGIDRKIPPIGLLDTNFKKHIDGLKDLRAKASEVEHAIKHHITINLERDPAYYQKLSERLQEILEAKKENWDALYQLLMDFRENIETEREKQAEDLGLDTPSFAFLNLLKEEAEKLQKNGVPFLQDNLQVRLIAITESVMGEVADRTDIVDFFRKEDEVRELRRCIKRELMDSPFWEHDSSVQRIMDRAMDLAKVHFGGGG